MEEYLTVSADISDLQSSSFVRAIPACEVSPPTDVFFMNHHPIIGGINHKEKHVPTMDMRNIDFIGTLQTMKKILHPQDDTNYYAIHTMNNSLLIDEINITGFDNYLSESHHSSTRNRAESSTNEMVLFPSQLRLEKSEINEQIIQSVIPSIPGLHSNKPQTIHDSVSHEVDGEESSNEPTNNESSDSSSCHLKDDVNHVISIKDMHLGSAHIPPAQHYMPSTPPSSRQIHLWQLEELRLALGSDLVLCSTDEHPVMTVKTLDTTQELTYQTCLDLYLDNIMASIPELALCLHSKGFIRGLHLCTTESIPTLHQSLYGPKKNSGKPVKQLKTADTPLFDPSVIELNAVTILRFLKENCNKDSSTYILRRSNSDDALQIYDLTTMSNAQQKRWKWLLAMVSHRFAVRLGHHISIGSRLMRHQIRERQLKLFSSCHQLLNEIKNMGGGAHETIQASLLEQMGDISLCKVDEHSCNNKLEDSSDDEFSLDRELQAAAELFHKAIGTIASTLKAKIDSFMSLKVSLLNEKSVACLVELLNIAREFTVAMSDSRILATSPTVDYLQDDSPIDRSDDEGTEGGAISDFTELLEALSVQSAGILHKLVTVTSLLINEAQKRAHMREAFDNLEALMYPLKLWTKLRKSIFAIQEELDSTLVGDKGLWGADKTALNLMPVLWSTLGELTRDVCRQMAGVTASSTREEFTKIVIIFVEFHSSTYPFVVDFKSNKLPSHLWDLLSSPIPADSPPADSILNIMKCSHFLASPCILSQSDLALSGFQSIVDDTRACSVLDIRPQPLTMQMTDELYVLLVMLYSYNCACLCQYLPSSLMRSDKETKSPRGVKSAKRDKSDSPNEAFGTYKSCLRRLAASCNQLGQVLLSTSSEMSKSGTVSYENPLQIHQQLALAVSIFYSAKYIFISIPDLSNAATLTCNYVSALRFQSNWILRHSSFYKEHFTQLSKFIKAVKKPALRKDKTNLDALLSDPNVSIPLKEALKILETGISQCKDSLRKSHNENKDNNRTVNINIYQAVSGEMAQTLLAIGLAIKAYVSGIGEDKIGLILQFHNEIVHPLEQALALYTELGNSKQAAAVSFQLGTFFYMFWTAEISKSNSTIEKATYFYGLAYTYYSRYDVGPVLVQILTDMADLYMAAYIVEEDTFKKFCPIQSSILQLSSEVIRSLLGGAYLALLDCRFAFTDVVVEMYKSQMSELVSSVSRRSCKVFMKVLSSKYLSDSQRISELSALKIAYKEMACLSQCHQKSVVNVESLAKNLFSVLENLHKLNIF